MDGAHGGSTEPSYDYSRFYRTIQTIQPEALISGGPDIRWVGNERGVAPETNWSTTINGDWQPRECDVSIRPSWFWKRSENGRVKSTPELLRIYFSSVGRNGVLLLVKIPEEERLSTEHTISELMGKDASARFRFIMANASEVDELDV